jgi:hypothetical protein
MAKCKFCGKDAGLFQDAHEACRRSQKGYRSLDQARAESRLIASPPRPLTIFGVFWAVFLALCAYGLVSAIVLAISRLP